MHIRAEVLVSSWAILEGQITIALEARATRKLARPGHARSKLTVSRMTFDKSGLGGDPAKMLEMPQILVRNRSTRD
jgi:hypothetical protein